MKNDSTNQFGTKHFAFRSRRACVIYLSGLLTVVALSMPLMLYSQVISLREQCDIMSTNAFGLPKAIRIRGSATATPARIHWTIERMEFENCNSMVVENWLNSNAPSEMGVFEHHSDSSFRVPSSIVSVRTDSSETFALMKFSSGGQLQKFHCVSSWQHAAEHLDIPRFTEFEKLVDVSPDLRNLGLIGFQIENAERLSRLKQLKIISLNGSSGDLGFVESLKKLEFISLVATKYNPDTMVTCLKPLTNLQTICVDDSPEGQRIQKLLGPAMKRRGGHILWSTQ